MHSVRRPLWLLLLACLALLFPPIAQTVPSARLLAAVTAEDWWDTGWSYRVPITVGANNHKRTDKPVEVELNFTTLLAGLGVSGPFDVNSLRVVEVQSNGTLTPNVPFQFDRASNFNKTSRAAGTLVFLMSGTTNAGASRTFHVYFDVEGAGFSAPSFTDRVILSTVTDEGMESYRIRTNNATYFYQKAAGGLSSLDDMDGEDWLNYHPTPPNSPSSTYRGFPNAVHPEGKLHPGATGHTTTLLHSGPLKETFDTTINTDSDSRQWHARWEIFPTYARMTLLDVDHDYWILYEGTPGGELEPSRDFVVRSNGAQNLASASWTGDIPGEEWVYFADPTQGRSLFLISHQEDNLVDSYRPMSDANGSMTVFGFGRQGGTKHLSATPASFTLGLMDTTTFAPAAEIIRSAYKPLTTRVDDAEEQNGNASYTLTVTVVGNGSVTVNPQKASYTPGEEVTLTAIPNTGHTFSGWSGAVSGTANPAQLTMNGNRSVTATFTPSGGSTAITIVKDAQPNAPRNFSFTGSLGDFKLDDAVPDDGDAYQTSRTFSVSAGSYTVRERYSSGWTLSALTCAPASAATVNLAKRQAQITIANGQQVSCTFVNSQTSTLRAISTGAVSSASADAGYSLALYDAQGVLLASQLPNRYGKVSFPGLSPGVYTLCSGANSELCHSLTLQPGQIAEVRFTHAAGDMVSAADAEAELAGNVSVSLTAKPTNTQDDELETDEPLTERDDEYLNTPATAPALYLPVITIDE
jgi:plastocyanin